MSKQESLFNRWVSSLVNSPMQSIRSHTGKLAGYGETTDVVRFASEGDPIYTALHHVRGGQREKRIYSPTHTHPFPELNILAAEPGELTYRIRLGDEENEVKSPAVILIPSKLPHSANFVSGSGEFVVVRLMPQQISAAQL